MEQPRAELDKMGAEGGGALDFDERNAVQKWAERLHRETRAPEGAVQRNYQLDINAHEDGDRLVLTVRSAVTGKWTTLGPAETAEDVRALVADHEDQQAKPALERRTVVA